MIINDEKIRHHKSLSGNGNNPPGFSHKNALLILDKLDVDFYYRLRKSSGAEKALSRGSSDTAFNWLGQSGLVSVVTGFWDLANHPHSLLVRLLLVSVALLLARCRSMAAMSPGSSCRASSGLSGVCVGCRLYDVRSAAIARLKAMRLAMFINSFSRMTSKRLFFANALVNGNSSWVLIRLPPGAAYW